MEAGVDIAGLAREVGALQTEMSNLKDWQKTQNGSLRRIEDKVDGYQRALAKLLGTALLSLGLLVIDIVTRVVLR